MKILLALIVLIAGFLLYLNYRTQPSVPTPPPISAEILQKLPQDRTGQVLIYGAYGYTGTGIAKLAKSYGIKPVLSGRNPVKLKKLADELGYDYIPLTLENNHDNLVKVLKHFTVVLHIAGPYTYTAKPMLEACVEAKTHYLDTTGENHVIQQMIDRSDEFKRANIQVMPAIGFDVMPTDSLNVYL